MDYLVSVVLVFIFFDTANSSPVAPRITYAPVEDGKVPYQFYHHDHDALYELMQNYSTQFPSITRLYSIGSSVEGRRLWVIEISDNPGVHELGEPEFKYVANMHGNEVSGRETLLYLMQYLCELYATNEGVRELVDSTRIHLLPTMNPDGYSRTVPGTPSTDYGIVGRPNANGFDLNRNFPDRFNRGSGPIQPETEAVMDWIAEYPFVLSANLHNGALVANYPYDNTESGISIYSLSPDDDIFRQLAKAYSFAHPTMHLGVSCTLSDGTFTDGITNGADWYSVDGGMQDYNYLNSNCFEVTIEQGCTKFPSAEDLPSIWNANRDSLLAYINEVHIGVAGYVIDDRGSPVANATIVVMGRDHNITTTVNGEYWRLLSPGSYSIAVYAEGFSPVCESDVEVPRSGKLALNFSLDLATGSQSQFVCTSHSQPIAISSLILLTLTSLMSIGSK